MEWRKIGYGAMFIAFMLILYYYVPGSSVIIVPRLGISFKHLVLASFTAIAIFLYFRSGRMGMHLLFFFILFMLLAPNLIASYALSFGSGTVLTNNWWEALNWIRNNTENCSVIATYWDPGHFITGIARRPVVFDGATQNALLVMDVNGTRIVRSRIQDIATTLFTDNETLAVEILRNYRIDGCDMYYIASRDLVFKSQWWTYFSTWKPGERGKMYVYYVGTIFDRKKSLDGSIDEFDFSLGGGVVRVFIINGTDIMAVYETPAGRARISRIVVVDPERGAFRVSSDGDIDATLLFYTNSPNVILIPRELENSLFTRMFFFNGAGLERFEFVKDWGGEVKLFSVRLE